MALPQRDDASWTYADYCRLPDDGKRYEIIDGRLYVNPAPSTPHQTVSGRLHYLFYPLEEEGRLFVFLAPTDVFLPGAEPVQPDLVVLTAEQRSVIKYDGIHGVPTLIIEVLSPSTAAYDRTIKLRKYAQSGVANYWLVSVAERTLEAFRLHSDGHYLLEASVSVGEQYAPREFPGVVVDMTRLLRDLPGANPGSGGP